MSTLGCHRSTEPAGSSSKVDSTSNSNDDLRQKARELQIEVEELGLLWLINKGYLLNCNMDCYLLLRLWFDYCCFYCCCYFRCYSYCCYSCYSNSCYCCYSYSCYCFCCWLWMQVVDVVVVTSRCHTLSSSSSSLLMPLFDCFIHVLVLYRCCCHHSFHY